MFSKKRFIVQPSSHFRGWYEVFDTKSRIYVPNTEHILPWLVRSDARMYNRLNRHGYTFAWEVVE